MAGSGTAHLRPDSDPLLTVEELVVEFPLGNTGLRVNAVSGISFDVLKGETLGLVGESGCGKSTTGRAIMQLPRPTGGQVRFDGAELTGLDPDDVRRVRPQMQMIFQDPISSLNPRRKVKDIVAEPLAIWKVGSDEEREQRVRTVLEDVGIDPRSRRAASRTSSRADSASASASPARSCSTPSWSSATSRCPRSTCPCRPRS